MVRLCFGHQEQSDDQLHDPLHDHIHNRIRDLSFGNARRFSYRSLQLATINFSDDLLIGKGGFARVYRGVLPNKALIAIKAYKYDTNTPIPDMVHLMGVVMSWTRHPNINKVIGYCIHENCWLLVSEYAENGSLYDLLHNQRKRSKPVVLSWPMRVAVCVGIARGVAYLHEDVNPWLEISGSYNPRAVHLDIKPANVLLDRDFTPKITDFDLVKVFPDDSNELPLDSDSVLNTVVTGTDGYVDPEYLTSGNCTQKSDVYGFGVTMLELVSGRKAFDLYRGKDNRLLADWASNLSRDGRVSRIIDPLLTDFPSDDMQRFIDVAFFCIKQEAEHRPSMREVIQMLDGSCNSVSRQLLASYSTPYVSAASSFRSLVARTDDAGEGVTESADSVTELLAQPEIEGAECSAAQSNAATVSQQVHVQQQLGIVLSGTGDLVERLSQTMVFNKPSKLDFPEAVYPPFRTRVFSRGGSRNLYTF